MADIFSMWALNTAVRHLPRVAKNPDDYESLSQMLYVYSTICFLQGRPDVKLFEQAGCLLRWHRLW